MDFGLCKEQVPSEYLASEVLHKYDYRQVVPQMRSSTPSRPSTPMPPPSPKLALPTLYNGIFRAKVEDYRRKTCIVGGALKATERDVVVDSP